MDNKVTHVLARSMMECGAPAFRFNFRGVGASGGTFDNGRGETDDLAAVVAEGRRRFPGAALWLGGLLVRRLRGPARRERPCAREAGGRGATGGALRARQRGASGLRLDAGAGRRRRRGAARGGARLGRGTATLQGRRLHVLAGAGHFFHGKLHELKPLVLDFLRCLKDLRYSLEKHKSPDVFRRRAFVARIRALWHARSCVALSSRAP